MVARPVVRWSARSAGLCPEEVEPAEAGPRYSAGRLLRVKSHQAATTSGRGSRWRLVIMQRTDPLP